MAREGAQSLRWRHRHTVTVLTEAKEQVRVRLYGIDTPESKQPFGSKATQFVRDLAALNQNVEVDVRDIDQYDRTVAVIILPDGRNLLDRKSSACFLMSGFPLAIAGL